jgi:hypothetical protein
MKAGPGLVVLRRTGWHAVLRANRSVRRWQRSVPHPFGPLARVRERFVRVFAGSVLGRNLAVLGLRDGGCGFAHVLAQDVADRCFVAAGDRVENHAVALVGR